MPVWIVELEGQMLNAFCEISCFFVVVKNEFYRWALEVLDNLKSGVRVYARYNIQRFAIFCTTGQSYPAPPIPISRHAGVVPLPSLASCLTTVTLSAIRHSNTTFNASDKLVAALFVGGTSRIGKEHF